MQGTSRTGSAQDGREPTPGRRRHPVFIAAVFVLLVAVLGYGTYGMTSTPKPDLAATASYLPKQQRELAVDRTVVGTYSSPALTIEGDYVEVKTPTFSALATVTGPYVPGEGLPVQMDWDTCTWTISISHVDGRLPVSVADFDSIDHLGRVYKPYLIPGRHIPEVLHTGQDLTFQVRAVMPVGEGLMRWAPNGNNIIAKWDYQVEND